jgi:hypothetical protein
LSIFRIASKKYSIRTKKNYRELTLDKVTLDADIHILETVHRTGFTSVYMTETNGGVGDMRYRSSGFTHLYIDDKDDKDVESSYWQPIYAILSHALRAKYGTIAINVPATSHGMAEITNGIAHAIKAICTDSGSKITCAMQVYLTVPSQLKESLEKEIAAISVPIFI